MDNGKTQILVLVEGERTDVRLMQHLLTIYGINQNHEIISYNTNIYKSWSLVGYNAISDDDIPEGLTILDAEFGLLSKTGLISVLCTCAFYIWDYNSNLLT